jgi:hypothetical protein
MRLSTSPWTSTYLWRNCHHFSYPLLRCSIHLKLIHWPVSRRTRPRRRLTVGYGQEHLAAQGPLTKRRWPPRRRPSTESAQNATDGRPGASPTSTPHRRGCSWYAPSLGTSMETLDVCSRRRHEWDMAGLSSTTRVIMCGGPSVAQYGLSYILARPKTPSISKQNRTLAQHPTHASPQPRACLLPWSSSHDLPARQ